MSKWINIVQFEFKMFKAQNSGKLFTSQNISNKLNEASILKMKIKKKKKAMLV
jgi:hypothetical protein